MLRISGTQEKMLMGDHLKHVEDVWDPGPGIVGRVHQEADDLKVPDEAHAQEKPECSVNFY